MRPKYKWLVVFVLVFFAIIHYVDRSLLSPLISTITDELGMNEEQIGLVSTATLIVTTIGFIAWGYLYDKYSRVILTTVAGVIWSFTTWLSALASDSPTSLPQCMHREDSKIACSESKNRKKRTAA